MKIFAVIYSGLLIGVNLWVWITDFLFHGSTEEHLLPGIILYILTAPSSLLMEGIVGLAPWMLDSPIVILALLTGFGGVQAILVWLIALKLGSV
jgi:hypothetical protein